MSAQHRELSVARLRVSAFALLTKAAFATKLEDQAHLEAQGFTVSVRGTTNFGLVALSGPLVEHTLLRPPVESQT